jgi:hypothetical protein
LAIDVNDAFLPASRPPAANASQGDGLAVAPGVRRMLVAWAMEELAASRLERPARATVAPRFLALNAKSHTIYVYEVSGGSVTLLKKPAGVEIHANCARRAHAYLAFFQEVCRSLPDLPPFHLALETGDKVTERVAVPVFAFQKRRGEKSVLLPDIDFLNHDFYTAPRYTDSRAYGSKLAKAIFVGSTSGGRVTPEVARHCTLPRLRAARHFEGSARVEFLLPQIVQTSGDEAADILRQMTFCQSPYVSFQEQLRHRFVISMDGNGATCSRVVLALKSNSVLLKYDSDDLLYYFRHLQPWLHYVPVRQDADIDAILDMEQESPAFFENIAEKGRQFAATYLSRDAVLAYTAALFKIYAACFSDPDGAARIHVAPVQKQPLPAAPNIVLVGHVQGLGDVAADGEGRIGDAKDDRAIEGFTFSFGNASLNRHLFYRSVAEDGTPLSVMPAGAYCGTRGQSMPLRGFVIWCATAAASVPQVFYEGVFRDGFSSGTLSQGTVCRSPRGAPLVAIRISTAAG